MITRVQTVITRVSASRARLVPPPIRWPSPRRRASARPRWAD